MGPAAETVDHLQPVDAGQTEVEQHDVGMVAGGQIERLLACLGGVDVVAARLQVGGEGTADRRLVVDDEHTRHACSFVTAAAASGRLTIIVVPPPGVSSTASSPPIASTKPRAIARPSPTPAVAPSRSLNR